ncbi:MAG: (d)CMP kinase [Candidatus Omnitrophica bacterium]|nr:(d)CMP kinase [Candidatus Omnitrophota bacterium]MBU4479422.1 (d)CMP kinase [Candidatus Omnitrophota bacterium]MCG2703967.1 (d)CMP kinase [Candidatus Omnitrophota bacterium]
MIVTIDGPAGAGKSTIAKLLAEKIGFLYVDTGAMYRALTLKIIRYGIAFSDTQAIVSLAKKTVIQLQKNDGTQQTKVMLDGNDVSEDIRHPEITNAVFNIAGMPEIRRIMVQWQRGYGKAGNIVMEGRDIGTVVFPHAEKKFYLDATPPVRAQRRFRELEEKGVGIGLDEVVRQIKDRDYKDMTRTCGPLKKADDAVYIDSTRRQISEVVDTLLTYLDNEKVI